MKANTPVERLTNGLFKENPTFVLTLGMCPTLAVTTSAVNGLGMGLTTMVVLAMSNMFISLLRKVIPDRVRIPAFIVIIASFVTVVELLLKAYIPFLYDALGLYIPLIVVNCIILGRAEAYASKNKVIPSLFDGVGMGLGFTMALTIIGAVREIIGAGTVFGYCVTPSNYVPCAIFVMAPGAFFVLATLTAIQNKIKINGTKKGKDMSKIQSGCAHDCMNCSIGTCNEKPEVKVSKPVEKKEDDSAPVKTHAEVPKEKKSPIQSEMIDLESEVADTVEITADDIAAINEAVAKSEEKTEESAKAKSEEKSEESVKEKSEENAKETVKEEENND